MNASPRYGLVKAIAFILKLLAWLALLLGVVVLIVGLTAANGPGIVQMMKPAGLVGLVVGIVWFVQLFAFGSILELLVDIEKNTHQLATEQPAVE